VGGGGISSSLISKLWQNSRSIGNRYFALG
jgi:hypothetical protein